MIGVSNARNAVSDTNNDCSSRKARWNYPLNYNKRKKQQNMFRAIFKGKSFKEELDLYYPKAENLSLLKDSDLSN
jgi:hypothetical protein